MIMMSLNKCDIISLFLIYKSTIYLCIYFLFTAPVRIYSIILNKSCERVTLVRWPNRRSALIPLQQQNLAAMYRQKSLRIQVEACMYPLKAKTERMPI